MRAVRGNSGTPEAIRRLEAIEQGVEGRQVPLRRDPVETLNMPHGFDKLVIDKGSLRTRVIPYAVSFGVGAMAFGSTFRANLDFAFSI